MARRRPGIATAPKCASARDAWEAAVAKQDANVGGCPLCEATGTGKGDMRAIRLEDEVAKFAKATTIGARATASAAAKACW